MSFDLSTLTITQWLVAVLIALVAGWVLGWLWGRRGSTSRPLWQIARSLARITKQLEQKNGNSS